MKKVVEVLIPSDKLQDRIREVAEEINRDYAGKEVHLVGILKGSVFFMCDLAKHLNMPVTMDFMSCSSYGSGTVSNGIVRLNKDLDQSIEGKNVIVVEDIIDSGHTLGYLVELLKGRRPESLKLCTLLDKPSRRVRHDIKVDYTCFEIEDKFVIGYGLDDDQYSRNLPYIGVVHFEEEEQ